MSAHTFHFTDVHPLGVAELVARPWRTAEPPRLRVMPREDEFRACLQAKLDPAHLWYGLFLVVRRRVSDQEVAS